MLLDRGDPGKQKRDGENASQRLIGLNYRFPNTTRLALYAAGSAALVLVGLASAVGSFMFTLKPKPRQFQFLSRS